jgi:hypothetical protein
LRAELHRRPHGAAHRQDAVGTFERSRARLLLGNLECVVVLAIENQLLEGDRAGDVASLADIAKSQRAREDERLEP